MTNVMTGLDLSHVVEAKAVEEMLAAITPIIVSIDENAEARGFVQGELVWLEYLLTNGIKPEDFTAIRRKRDHLLTQIT